VVEWFFMPYNFVSTIIFNATFFLVNIALIYFGYRKADIKLVNIGIFWLTIFIISKYFIIFFDMLNSSLFFFVGGLILVVGGMMLEKKHKNIKQQFLKINAK